MARTNKKVPKALAPRTHQGGIASRIPKTIQGATIADGKVVRTVIPNALERLRRSVLACLLWEDEFYESGQSITARIVDAAQDVAPGELAMLAAEARSTYNLRSVPMLLLSTLIERVSREKTGAEVAVAETIATVVRRADELAELVALYWRDGKRPLTNQMKKGLAAAFQKFDAYQLAKYNRDNAITLRDVMFLTHPKPRPCGECEGKGYGFERDGGSDEKVRVACPACDGSGKDIVQSDLFKQLASNTLPTPDTWETELSAGKDKKATFERLLQERKLGYLALLRNLRNMAQAGVSPDLITTAILERKGARYVFPFRYIAAARSVPQYEAVLDKALQAAIVDLPVLRGKTVILVDVSASMDDKLSSKSDLSRLDAGAALASIIPVGMGSPEKLAQSPTLRVFTFSERLVEVPARRGMAGIDAVRSSQPHMNTFLATATRELASRVEYDRLIVVSDEQSADGSAVLRPGARGYMVNVASAENGVNYEKGWVHLTGFSENILRFIYEYERETPNTFGEHLAKDSRRFDE